ncbi:MAG: hypothetical protein K6E41_04505 [Solobacterium sp.]|nr:hypothetical protein [Solobacterium sp.]
MAINLATKYESKMALVYTRKSLLQGKTNEEYSWDGVNSIHVYTPVTQPLNDYVKSGTWRYGSPAELQDTQQEMAITLDKSFSITVDRGNNDDQMHAKRSGEVVNAQVGEQVTPFFDKYALIKWAKEAGQTSSVTSAVTKDTVLDMFIDAHSKFFNAAIPVNGKEQYAYVSAATYAKLLRNPEFISADSLNKDLLTNGVVGKCMGFLVVETPDDYLNYYDATADKAYLVQALFVNKKSVVAPTKLNELFIRNDVPGISGTLIEGRYRGDAHVLDAFEKGVLVAKYEGILSL